MSTRMLLFLAIAGTICGCSQPTDNTYPPSGQAEPSHSTFQPKVAGVGVGERGRSLDNEQGVGKVIAGPAIAYFNARERIAFEIAVPHALNLYQALNGDYPKSHDEFMDKIIRENRIDLPKLPRNAQYRYHPEDHQLWVEPIDEASTNGGPSDASSGP